MTSRQPYHPPYYSQPHPNGTNSNKRTKSKPRPIFVKFIKCLDSKIEILISLFAFVSLFFLLFMTDSISSGFQTLSRHSIYYYNHPTACTWSLFESGVYHLAHPIEYVVSIWGLFSLAASGNGIEADINIKLANIDMNMNNSYTIQQHALEFPYTYQGNRKSCYNSHKNPKRNPLDTDTQTETGSNQIFTQSLIPTPSKLIIIPEKLTCTMENLIKISHNMSLQNTHENINLFPLITSLETLNTNILSLQETHNSYLELWLHTIDQLSNSWSNTISQISSSITLFETSLKSRSNIHSQFPFHLAPIASYRKSQIADNMRKQIQEAHWVQILNMKYHISELISAGRMVWRQLNRERLAISRLEAIVSNLMREIKDLELELDSSSGVWRKKQQSMSEYQNFFGQLRAFFRFSSGSVSSEYLKDSPLDIVKRELNKLNNDAERKLFEIDNLVSAWGELDGREKVGGEGGCWFPGILTEEHGGDWGMGARGKEKGLGWPMEFDERSKDWILQVRRWCRGRDGLVRSVNAGKEWFLESIGAREADGKGK